MIVDRQRLGRRRRLASARLACRALHQRSPVTEPRQSSSSRRHRPPRAHTSPRGAGEARSTLAALEPQPFAPDRKGALAALQATLGQTVPRAIPASSGSATASTTTASARAFADGLAGCEPQRHVRRRRGHAGRRGARPFGRRRRGRQARGDGAAHRRSASAKARSTPFRPAASGSAKRRSVSAPGETSKRSLFELPLELRNQVTRIEIAGEHSAGAVSLLDGRSQWQRVGLISGESQEQAQPLLAPLYYIEKAIQPFAEIVRSQGSQSLASASTTHPEAESRACSCWPTSARSPAR